MLEELYKLVRLGQNYVILQRVTCFFVGKKDCADITPGSQWLDNIRVWMLDIVQDFDPHMHDTVLKVNADELLPYIYHSYMNTLLQEEPAGGH